MIVTGVTGGRLDRHRAARYGGLVGALLLALAATLGGARPRLPADPQPDPVSIWATEHGPLVLSSWLVGTALLVGAWWALRAGAPSLRWAYVTVGLWVLPLLVAPPLGSRDVYSYACQGQVYAAGHDPYGAGVAVLGCPWVESVAVIWRDTPAPYGPVFVVLAGVASALGGSLVGTLVVLRLLALAGVLLTAACLPGLARLAGVPPQRAVWLVLACPLSVVHLVGGAHNEAILLGLLLAGLLVVLRHPGRPAPLLVGGALLGLAVAVKVTALVVLPFAVLGAVLGRYTLGALARDGGWVVGGAVGAAVAASSAAGLGPGWVAGLSHSDDSAQWTSLPTAVGLVVDYAAAPVGGAPGAVSVLRLVALVGLAGLLVALWWSAWRRLRRLGTGRQRVTRMEAARPRTALTGAGLALAGTVVLAPVFHPWYALWPLALLALSPVRVAWYALPCAVAAFLTLPDGTNLARLTKAPGALVMTLLAVVLAVGWFVRPGSDRGLRHRPGRGRSAP